MQKLIPTSRSADVDGLQMVNNETIFRELCNGSMCYFIRHYDTIIFAYDPVSKLCEINHNCSRTSNNQIGYALNFFGLSWSDAKDVGDGSKWAYSRQMYQVFFFACKGSKPLYTLKLGYLNVYNDFVKNKKKNQFLYLCGTPSLKYFSFGIVSSEIGTIGSGVLYFTPVSSSKANSLPLMIPTIAFCKSLLCSPSFRRMALFVNPSSMKSVWLSCLFTLYYWFYFYIRLTLLSESPLPRSLSGIACLTTSKAYQDEQFTLTITLMKAVGSVAIDLSLQLTGCWVLLLLKVIYYK